MKKYLKNVKIKLNGDSMKEEFKLVKGGFSPPKHPLVLVNVLSR